MAAEPVMLGSCGREPDGWTVLRYHKVDAHSTLPDFLWLYVSPI